MLKRVKCSQLKQSGVSNPSDDDVNRHITKKELAIHCRRKTRGVEEMTQLIYDLLEAFQGNQGRDTLGVPLLDAERIWDIWESQKKHIKCIRDPEGIQLYLKTGVVCKGGVELPVYRCARGSTSLESFHLHYNRFIPGTFIFRYCRLNTYCIEILNIWITHRFQLFGNRSCFFSCTFNS